jgi:hypothetical protein
MALRATYYGLKRKFARKINIEGVIPDAAGSNNPLITNDRYLKLEDFVEVTGARNILPPSPVTSRTDQGITFTVETSGDFAGCITLSGANAGTSAAVLRYNITLQPGSYRLYGRVNDNIWVGLYAGTSYKYSTASKNGVSFTLDEATTYGFTVRVGGPVTITPDISLISPMIIYDFDPNTSTMFAPYALPNRDLTVRSEETKAAVNGILSAASSAADFAAFKTALAALSPVTRSAAPAERSLQVEEPVEDTPKKSTKKTTKKEDS